MKVVVFHRRLRSHLFYTSLAIQKYSSLHWNWQIHAEPEKDASPWRVLLCICSRRLSSSFCSFLLKWSKVMSKKFSKMLIGQPQFILESFPVGAATSHSLLSPAHVIRRYVSQWAAVEDPSFFGWDLSGHFMIFVKSVCEECAKSCGRHVIQLSFPLHDTWCEIVETL